MSNTVIATHQLERHYQSYSKSSGLLPSLKRFFKRDRQIKHALLPLNLEIARGQIVGIVGANGAGKTTLLKLLSGLIYPTAGSVDVLGYAPHERKNAFLCQISLLLGQKNQLWWDIAASDSFQLLIAIYDLDTAAAQKQIDMLADRLDCKHVLHTPLRRLSLGERMKMELIGSLLHSPQILFLDEPTIGLDVMAQNSIRQFILEELKGRGITILLTSHYMDDIAQLADRLLLMSRGAIVYDGTVHRFMSQTIATKRLIVDFNEPLPRTLRLSSEIVLPEGTLILDHSFPANELVEVLKILTLQTQLRDLKIEEPDFEHVIRSFLEAESGLSKARRPN